MGSDAALSAGNAGIYGGSSWAGNTLRNCHFGTNGGPQLVYGVYVAGSPSMNNNLVENNVIMATSGGFYCQTTPDDSNSVIRRNTICSGTAGAAMAVGIKTGPYALVVENMICAVDCISTGGGVTTALNCINNHEVQGGSAAIEYAAT